MKRTRVMRVDDAWFVVVGVEDEKNGSRRRVYNCLDEDRTFEIVRSPGTNSNTGKETGDAWGGNVSHRI
jgi:hypothetical protein